jgi:hypothetical protein
MSDKDQFYRKRDKPLSEQERKAKRPFNVFQGVNEQQEEPDDDIILERLDQFGRKMTPLERFKEMSHVFHGTYSGKNKQAKKHKRYLEELRQRQMSDTDTPLRAMEHHERVTQALQQPYVLVDKANLAIVAKASKEVRQAHASERPKKRNKTE